MKPNMIPFFLLLFVISLFLGYGWVVLPILIFFEIWILCVSRENTLFWSLLKRRSAKQLMSVLCDEYGINGKEFKGGSMKNSFPNCISAAFLTEKGSKYDLPCFDAVMEAWKSSCSKKIIWTEVVVRNKPIRSRKPVLFSKAQKKVVKRFKEGFSLQCESSIYWVYPQFIIKETREQYELIKWESLSCVREMPVLLENKGIINNPDNILPYKIKYLHSNKDGSPDLRYKSNPSHPVYLFTPVSLKIGDEVRLLFLNKNDACLIVECMNAYIKTVNARINNYISMKQSEPASITYNPESIMNTII